MLSIFSHLIFGSPKLLGFRQDGKTDSWKDKSIRFDLKRSDSELSDAEQLIACFFPIEDVKGNLGELGCLKLTNLRLIWLSGGKKRVNLSIGWGTVSLVFEQTLKDSLGSPLSSIYVLTRFESTKYEFIFNQMPSNSESVANQLNYRFLDGLKKSMDNKILNLTHLTPMYLAEPFDTVLKILQSYKSSWLFRQCQANLSRLVTGPSDKDRKPNSNRQFEIEKLNWLPGEEMIDLFSGVCHVESRSARHTGTLILSNIRLIWVDDTLPVRNLSLPYIRISSFKVKSLDRIVLSISDHIGASNQIELRTSKPSSTSNQGKSICDQIQKLCNLYKSKPHYGPECCDDCLNLMCLLKPVELYFDTPIFELASDGLAMPKGLVGSERMAVDQAEDETLPASRRMNDSTVEHNEEELKSYNCKLNKYLDEMPSNPNEKRELISAFGLAFEKPAAGIKLDRLWSLEIM